MLSPGIRATRGKAVLRQRLVLSFVVAAVIAAARPALAAAGIAVDPTAVSFGDQAINTTSAAQQIVVTSTGTDPLTIKSIRVAGPFTWGGVNPPLTLQPGARTTITVVFAPTVAGPTTGSLSIESDAPTSPTDVALTGNGTVAQMVLAPPTWDFGPVALGRTSPPQAIDVSNTGTAPLVVTRATISGPFAVQNLPMLPTTIPAGGRSTWQVTFTPAQVGAVSGGVAFASNDPNSPITLVLVGTGASLGLGAAPDPLDFGNVQIVGAGAGVGATRTIQLTSNLNQKVTIQSIQLAPNAPEWSIDNLPNLPLTLQPMAATPLSVTFKPQAHGARAAVLTVVSDAPNSPTLVDVTGVGVGPRIAAMPNPLDFGAVNVLEGGTALLTLQNTGESALHTKSFTFGGPNGAEFSSISPATMTVEAGASAQIALLFTPAAAGPRTGRITIVNDDQLQPAFDVNLTGTGATPKITATPAKADFGAVNVRSQTAPLLIAIGNGGGANLTIRAMMIGGGDAAAFQLAVPALPLVVPPGGTRTISPLFAPLMVGPASARLTLVTDDPNAMNFDIPLAGTGLAPMISVDTAMIDFGSQIVGKSSQPKTVNIRNAGTAPLTLNSLGIAGPQGASFTLVNPPMLPATLAPGMKQPVTLVHTPAAIGMDGARLVIASDDALSPTATVALAGAGASAVIAVSPMSIDFGAVRAPGRSPPVTVTITNTGGDLITLVDADVTGLTPKLFSVESAAGGLAPGEMRTVRVTFAPTATGDATAVVVFRSIDRTIPPAAVSVTGRGAAAKLSAVPGTLDFGDVLLGATAAKTVTLTNVSAAPVRIAAAFSDNALFGVSGVDTTANIAPSGRMVVTVTFGPSAEGAAQALISVAIAGGAGAEVIVPATGRGTTAVTPDGGGGGAAPGGGCAVGYRRGAIAGAAPFCVVLGFVVWRRRRARR